MRTGVAVAFAAMLALAACEVPGADDSTDKTLTYKSWEPVYDGFRAATQADVDEIFARVDRRNGLEWTAHLDGMAHIRVDSIDTEGLQVEMEYTPDHVRFTSADQSMEVHVSLSSGSAVFVLCVIEDKTCKEVSEAEDLEAPPQEAMKRVALAVFPQLVSPLRRDLLREGQGSYTGDNPRPPYAGPGVFVANVDSPMGTLDCLSIADAADDLDGEPVELQTMGADRSAFRASTHCVDAHGLVVIETSFALVFYSSLREGIGGDIRDYPFRPEFAPKG